MSRPSLTVYLASYFSRLYMSGGLFAFFRRIILGVKTAWFTSACYRLLTAGKTEGGGIILALGDFCLNLIPRGCLRLSRTNAFGESALIRALPRGFYVLAALYAGVVFVFPHERWNNLWYVLGAFGLTAAFMLGNLSGERREFKLGRAGACFTLWALWLFCSTLFSYSANMSLRFFLFHLAGLLVVLMFSCADFKVKHIDAIIGVLTGVLFIASLYACYQMYTGVPVKPSEVDTEVFADITTRVYSFYDNPNVFSEVIIMLAPFSLALFSNAQRRRTKLYIAVTLAVTLAATVFTYSRSGWAGLAFAVIVYFLLMYWRVLPVLFAAGVASLPLLPGAVAERLFSIFSSSPDTSVSYRVKIASVMGQMSRDFALGGTGLGTDVTQELIKNYDISELKTVPLHFHNIYKQITVETGAVGITLFILTIIALVRGVLLRMYKPGVHKGAKRYMAAGAASLAGIMLVGTAEYFWYYPRFILLFYMVIGLTKAAVYAEE